MPNYWVPSFMLTWTLWGPLSDAPDGDFAVQSSSGPDGCDAGESPGGCDEDRKPSFIVSKEGIKMLAPMSSGLSREKRKALERQEKARKQKENNGSTTFEKMWNDNNEQTAKEMETLKILSDDIHENRRAEEQKESLRLRQEALRNLKEELEIARDEEDEDEIRAITKRRKKLLRTPPISLRRYFNIVKGVYVGDSAGSGGCGVVGANGAGVIGTGSDGVFGGRSGTDMDGAVICCIEEYGVPASGGGGVGGSGTDVDGAGGADGVWNGVSGGEVGGSATGVDGAGGGYGDGNRAVVAGVGGGGVGGSGTGVDGAGGIDGDLNGAVGAGVGGCEVGGSGTNTDGAAGGVGDGNGAEGAGFGGGRQEWPMITDTNGAGSGGSTSGNDGGKGKGVASVDSDDDDDLSDVMFENFGVRTLSEVARGVAPSRESVSVINVEM